MKRLLLPLLLLVACGDDASNGLDASMADAAPMPPTMDLTRDILTTSLHLDLTALTGHAAITIAPSMTSTGASFETKGLTITKVSSPAGPLAYSVTDGRLDVGIPSGTSAPEIDVDYGFTVHNMFDGYLTQGMTFLWPYFCSNLFPCKSAPDDGVKFTLDVTGFPAGKTAVYPSTISGDAPSYMIAFAVDDYTKLDLGTTSAGTNVHIWYRPGEQATATAATAHLKDEFDWYEKTYGAYSFGNDVGSVSVNWGPGDYGGMEHHPYWHVNGAAIGDEVTNVHESAHGWFGDGVRIACWEDFVLSEGTVSYLAARALEVVEGQAKGDAVWSGYTSELSQLAGTDLVWPDGCNQIDVLAGLFSNAPYMRGAFFYRGVALKVGAAALDHALATFFQKYRGQAAHMSDMLDVIRTDTGYDPAACAQMWLKDGTVPAPGPCP